MQSWIFNLILSSTEEIFSDLPIGVGYIILAACPQFRSQHGTPTANSVGQGVAREGALFPIASLWPSSGCLGLSASPSSKLCLEAKSFSKPFLQLSCRHSPDSGIRQGNRKVRSSFQ